MKLASTAPIFPILTIALMTCISIGAESAETERLRYRQGAEYSHSARGTAVLVLKNGSIVFEDYADGWNANKPHALASGTKSFAGLLAVCAMQDGLLLLDERVSDTLIEWKSDPKKESVTIRQLLSLSSGIAGGPNGSVPTYSHAVKHAVSSAEPDTKFQYGPIPFQCFGEVLKRKLAPTGETVAEYAKRRLIDPLEMRVAHWRGASDGDPRLPSGLALTPREWAKFGELIRLGGRVGDRSIVDESLLKECFVPASTNSSYGMTFWLLGRAAQDITQVAEDITQVESKFPTDIVAAMGKGKNRCYIIPSMDLVIIRMGDSRGRKFTDSRFLQLMLGR